MLGREELSQRVVCNAHIYLYCNFAATLTRTQQKAWTSDSTLKLVRSLFRHENQSFAFTFARPLVLLQSDDWGRVGLRDQDGLDSLNSHGLRLGEHPYDLYSLETADDLDAVASVFQRHHDSVGQTPCMVMNFCTANFDFSKMREKGFHEPELLPLSHGLPGRWSRPGLFKSYINGIRKGVFYPGLHGLTHCCPVAITNALRSGGERARLLRLMWEAETPYIYWRMPWIGYEYWNPEKPKAGFCNTRHQQSLIRRACGYFIEIFGIQPFSACAPGYRSNDATHRAWESAGIRVARHGTGSNMKAPHLDPTGLLHLYRTVDFEPAHGEQNIEEYLKTADCYFSRGLPLIISVHSINFHSSLRDFRTPSLRALDFFLTALERNYQSLLYVHDSDLYSIVSQGAFRSRGRGVEVPVLRRNADVYGNASSVEVDI